MKIIHKIQMLCFKYFWNIIKLKYSFLTEDDLNNHKEILKLHFTNNYICGLFNKSKILNEFNSYMSYFAYKNNKNNLSIDHYQKSFDRVFKSFNKK